MLRLTRADVERFAAHSGDHNPLHVRPEYALATAFGQPIVHGVLGLLFAMRALPERPGKRLRKLAVEFPRPMLVDTDYTLAVHDDGPDGSSLELCDGSKPVVRGVLEFCEGAGPRVELGGLGRERAQPRVAAELRRGQTSAGRYAPPGFAASAWVGHDRGVGSAQVLALMLCSYVIGMELPGELALFTRLALEFDEVPDAGELRWEARVDGWSPRTGSLRIGLELHVGQARWARGTLRAFVRADADADEAAIAPGERELASTFAGKTAVVIGASRGLGRSLARRLAAHGARVHAVSRSSATAPDQLQADAGDPEQLARALAKLERIDLLVCNASPPLQPLTLEPATATRVEAHIRDAVALVSTPLCVCLPRLAESCGVALLSSSEAVTAPPAEWAHYVAGKRAAEGLFEVAALQYPSVGFLVARMPRLATAFSLNVSGEAAASTAAVARDLVEQLTRAQPGFELLTSFARA